MTKDAKGRGDATPPDHVSRALDVLRVNYERTGNPIWVWAAIEYVDRVSGLERLEAEAIPVQGASLSPPEPTVNLPFWCWPYLCGAARKINFFAKLHDDDVKTSKHVEEKISESLENITMRLRKLEELGENLTEIYAMIERLKSTNKAESEADFRQGAVTAKKAANAISQIFGFVDGKGYNAFYDHWRAEKRKAVAYALEVSRESGMTREEANTAVSEMTGISDEPTIRRYVKEAKGKALPRRRSKKPKAPKGKKD